MWISEYLKSLDETEFRRLFLDALARMNPKYVKLIHSPIEYGRDIIAIFEDDLNLYQLKVGNIDTIMWEREVEPQVRKMFSVPLDDVRVDEQELNKKGYIVFTGVTNIYIDKPIKFLTEFYKEHFKWDIYFWDITSVCNFFVENELENLLISKTIWYELQTVLSKLEAVELELNEFYEFTNKLIERCKLIIHQSFRKWLTDYVMDEIKKYIKKTADENALTSYKFFEVCFIEFAITKMKLEDMIYYDEYFRLSDVLDLVVVNHKFIGADWSDFNEVTRNFALTLLSISASIIYHQKYNKDASQLFDELAETVKCAFDNLWFYEGNPGRNYSGNITELETIAWFTLPILLLVQNGNSSLAETWLKRIAQYLRISSKIQILDDYTSSVKFIFLELIILINSPDLYCEAKDFLVDKPLLFFVDGIPVTLDVDECYDITIDNYKKRWNESYLSQFDFIELERLVELISTFRGRNNTTTINYVFGHIRRFNCSHR